MIRQQVALVTGANKGIGYEVAAGLAALGMTVLLGSRDPVRGATAAAKLGDNVHPVALDVTDDASVAAAARLVAERHGALDVLVNNAGISGRHASAQPGGADVAALRDVFETNVFGVVRVTDALLPLLLRSPAGRIVNVGSGVGSLARMSDPADYLARIPANVSYAPSKTALNALTVQYAKELRPHGVLVNTADPGPCATDFAAGVTHHLTEGSSAARHPGFSRTAADGAKVVLRLATLDDDGPTGGYFNEDGPVPW
ncbi:3-oxoacyl-[acyl-carrier-protein] reductase FabG [Actinomadura rubteroloni]|uniref:3-oxoacyl-[acyl-carrier-protein] reductase FabG n=1 Tax=Actinomadura rubteroloni TaxID=1926885 RepID=A0A2P4UD15_9ACTN|nr:SDR family NAD(P)-dependent oxidoreductase [Actinomadura rubteroloni]POM22943.1 3-oxoacyl-[acyl-carrier-protein] reductase FabG [Actinomadura rubteroloni]